jgi:hypothetical protein
MKKYIIPSITVIRLDTKDILCSSMGFASDEDVFEDPSGEGGGGASEGSNGSYDLPIV